MADYKDYARMDAEDERRRKLANEGYKVAMWSQDKYLTCLICGSLVEKLDQTKQLHTEWHSKS